MRKLLVAFMMILWAQIMIAQCFIVDISGNFTKEEVKRISMLERVFGKELAEKNINIIFCRPITDDYLTKLKFQNTCIVLYKKNGVFMMAIKGLNGCSDQEIAQAEKHILAHVNELLKNGRTAQAIGTAIKMSYDNNYHNHVEHIFFYAIVIIICILVISLIVFIIKVRRKKPNPDLPI